MKSTFKILVTGKNQKVAADIVEHLEMDRGYQIVSCEPTKGAIFDSVMSENARIVIICVSNENVDTVKVYDVLYDAIKRGSLKAIVVANEEDEKFFLKYSKLERVFFVSRPVPLFALYDKLEMIEDQMRNGSADSMAGIWEYVKEDPGSEYERKHILVVDDDPEQLVMIKEQLKEFYDVTLLKSGDSLFKYLGKHIPDLILLDYVMPDTSGPEILRRMREFKSYADIPVVFLTGVAGRDAIIHIISELRPQMKYLQMRRWMYRRNYWKPLMILTMNLPKDLR